MKSASKYRLVLVTAPDAKTARKLAQTALKVRLIACANLIANLESHYWWQGKIERSQEILLLFKTTHSNLDRLEKLILRNHPYDTPEVLVLSLRSGNQRYLNWIRESCGPVAERRRKKG